MSLRKQVVSLLALTAMAYGPIAKSQMPEWSYDAGPNPETQMGRELIDITANIPNMPEISRQIIGKKQKFRPAFGPIPWRMLQTPNKVKILFMGQDGTHIAEAAGRPATAGFGGRAQDLAKYFGVNEGAAFINAYAFTIKGQYGVYGSPYVYTKNGKSEVRSGNIVSNKLWAISNNLNSPIVKWRNSLIDWIIRNNKDSMKLIVLFGGSARDAIATYARSKGAEVKALLEDDMENIQVPELKSEYAGGNNTFPSLVARDGGDLYADMLGRRLKYSDSKDQKAALDDLRKNLKSYLKEMVFTKGGPYGNGLLNPAQLSGYDLDTMIVNGTRTRSLKGLTLDDGTKIKNDIIVVSLPHPSSLSRTVMNGPTYDEGKKNASDRVMKQVKKLDRYREAGWSIKADPGKVNRYAQGKAYVYGRSDIGPEFYDFGTPANRMVSKSTAKRMSGAANVVIIGTRDNGKFDKKKIKIMTNAKAADGIIADNLYIARPSVLEQRYTFDPGPGEYLAKLMVTNLNLDEIFTPKRGMSFEKDGIAAYNVKTHPSVSDFGHYRGKVKNPKVVVLADPIGYDDLVTARALTGERGQYLQGLMNDLGVEDDYLVIKTVPFGMDGANEKEWTTVLKQTRKYRAKLLKAVLKNANPDFILTDGKYAAAEIKSILGSRYEVINTYRAENGQSSGIKRAGEAIKETLSAYADATITGAIANIPRSHLSFYARTWEGTSGDRVITSKGKKYEGIAFAEVVPSWAYNQRVDLDDKSSSEVEDLIQILRENDLPLPYESVPKYLERTEIDPSFSFMSFLQNWVKQVA